MLSHLKVLDFSTLLPGPYASMMLADMGADVLRIESPTRTDLLREMPPYDGGSGAAHMYLNRSKRLLALDLKKAEAAQIVKDLVAEYDIVLEQFRPGVMDRLGLGYSVLSSINPQLIYCAITGYGQDGPYKDRAGHDINYLALSGVASYSRRKDAAPVPMGVQLADVAGGSMHAIAGILAAVCHRQQTGQGQMIDISMTDAAFSMNALSGPSLLVGEQEPAAESMILNGGSFYDYYQTRDGRYFSVGSLEPPFFAQLMAVFDRQDWQKLANSLFKPDSREKSEAQAQLKQEIADEFLRRDFDQLQALFAGVDACVEPVLTVSEASEHPQLKSREPIVEVPKPDGHSQRQLAHPIRYSGYKVSYPHVAGSVGEHTTEVLKELGYSDVRIQELLAETVIVQAEA